MWQFNPQQHEPLSGGGETFAEGWYPVIVRKSNWKPTKDDPTQAFMELIADITGGPSQSKQYTLRLNLFNKNAQAVDIANRTLSAICHATGVYNVQAQEVPDNVVPMLHNQPFMLRIQNQRNGDGQNAVEFATANGTIVGKKGGQVTALAGTSGAANGPGPGAPPAGFGAAPGPAAAPMQPQPAPAGQAWGTPGVPPAAPGGAPQPGWGGQPGMGAPQPGGPAPAPMAPPAGPQPGAPAWGGGQPAAPQPAPAAPAPAWGGQPAAPAQPPAQPPAQGGWGGQPAPAQPAPGGAPWGAR